jgi:Uma2 family endonuclease
MATTLIRQMTVEEFSRLPETGPFYYELRHGELVSVTRPKLKHHLLQDRLVGLLREAAGGAGYVSMEVAFRPLPDYELRVADVAYISRERWENIDPESYFQGAPDLVIEVLSPSNTAYEINDKEKLCLENGAREFWVVDPKLRQVKVSTPDGITTTCREGQEVPLRIFGAGALKVETIFV